MNLGAFNWACLSLSKKISCFQAKAICIEPIQDNHQLQCSSQKLAEFSRRGIAVLEKWLEFCFVEKLHVEYGCIQDHDERDAQPP